MTGATGYIGSAVATTLLSRDHQVLGLARSARSEATLRDRGIEPARGDFGDPAMLGAVVTASEPDVVVSAASVGASAGDNATTFARDRDAVRASQRALHRPEQGLVFTSGQRPRLRRRRSDWAIARRVEPLSADSVAHVDLAAALDDLSAT